MVGGRQAQPVGVTQAAHAAEIKGVTMGDGPTLPAIAAGRGAAGARELAPISYIVARTLAFSVSVGGRFTSPPVQA